MSPLNSKHHGRVCRYIEGNRTIFDSGQVVFEVPMQHQTAEADMELKREWENVVTILSGADAVSS